MSEGRSGTPDPADGTMLKAKPTLTSATGVTLGVGEGVLVMEAVGVGVEDMVVEGLGESDAVVVGVPVGVAEGVTLDVGDAGVMHVLEGAS